jgi:hypothetical protein
MLLFEHQQSAKSASESNYPFRPQSDDLGTNLHAQFPGFSKYMYTAQTIKLSVSDEDDLMIGSESEIVQIIDI